MVTVKKFLVVLVGVVGWAAFDGCTTLVPWKPMYKGVEIKGNAISINTHGVSIKIARFGYWNSSRGPEAHISIKNYSDQEVRYDVSTCKLQLIDRLVSPSSMVPPSILLKPGEKQSVIVRFSTKLEHGGLLTRKDGVQCVKLLPSSVSLVLGTILVGEKVITLPSVDYAEGYENCYLKKFL